MHPRQLRSPVWAVTSYFAFDDPHDAKRRLKAYRRFRERLQVPLAAVEHAPDGDFDLCKDDAEILLQLRGGAMLWQKERLLNIAVEALPAECDTVAWIDCDVVLARDDWPEALRASLDEFALVQPFRRLHYQDGDGSSSRLVCDSVAHRFAAGDLPEEAFEMRRIGQMLRLAQGFAWGARRSLIQRHRLYDAMIVGGGDKAIFSAATKRQDHYPPAMDMSAQQTDHYLRWAEPFAEDVAGRIGSLEGDAYHLWHGDLKHRDYQGRYEKFMRFDFDPEAQLRQTQEGVWDWSGAAPDLQRWVQQYFENRRR